MRTHLHLRASLLGVIAIALLALSGVAFAAQASAPTTPATTSPSEGASQATEDESGHNEAIEQEAPVASSNRFHGNSTCNGIVGLQKADAAREIDRRGYDTVEWRYSVGNMPATSPPKSSVVVDVKATNERRIFVHLVQQDDPWAQEVRSQMQAHDCS